VTKMDKAKARMIGQERWLENYPGLRLLLRVAGGGALGAGAGAVGVGSLGALAANNLRFKGANVGMGEVIGPSAGMGAALGILPGAFAGLLYNLSQERQRTQDLIRAGLE